MPSSKRPEEAILPQPARPQLAKSDSRSRPSHLARITRYPDGAIPSGLPQHSGSLPVAHHASDSTCSYRNAAFQALLNAPMFVEFLRSHNRSIRKREKCCSVRKCLVCATYTLAKEYWSTDKQQIQIAKALSSLWNLCWEVFWGREKPDRSRIGPDSREEDFYTDAFLLHFLAAMQQQLEIVPSEFSTFQSLFTVHLARRWKCKSCICKWTGLPFKWESSFFLPIQVQKPHPRKPRTTVVEGLNAGLTMWAQKKLTSRRGSASYVSACGKCGGEVVSDVDIVNLPELLILVRNTELLNLEQDSSDISYSEFIDLKSSSLQCHDKGKATLSRYQLVSGTMEQRSPRKNGYAVAFARGPADSECWYGFDDVVVDRVESLEQIDAQQRPIANGGIQPTGPLLLPEILIYRRVDDDGWNYEYQADQAPVQSAPIPDLYQEDRLGISRSIHERFVYQVGQGHLKFKVDLFPGDPEPQDIVDFSIDLGYEFNGNHWTAKLQSKLLPLTGSEDDFSIPQPTAFKLRPVYRSRRRKEGAVSPTTAQAEREGFATDCTLNSELHNDVSDDIPSYPSKNPFNTTSSTMGNAGVDGMDLDPTFVFNPFKRDPKVEAGLRRRELEAVKTALAQLSDWTPAENQASERQRGNKGQARNKSSKKQVHFEPYKKNRRGSNVSNGGRQNGNGNQRRASLRSSRSDNSSSNQNRNHNNHSNGNDQSRRSKRRRN